jgi:hypothetical protein
MVVMTSEHVSGAESGAERAEKLVSGSGTFEKKRGTERRAEVEKIVERGAAF